LIKLFFEDKNPDENFNDIKNYILTKYIYKFNFENNNNNNYKLEIDDTRT